MALPRQFAGGRYYSCTCLAAYDLVRGKLRERWYFCSDDEANRGYGGQGFHTLREADVDFDGRDEILYGHMCGDHDGKENLGENLRGQTLRASLVRVGTDPSWSAGGVWG